MQKVNEELQKQLSQILEKEFLGEFLTVQAVETAPDLKTATVWVSILKGTQKEKEEKINQLQELAGEIQKLLAKKIRLKFTPRLQFRLDLGPERAVQIDKILDSLYNKKGK